MYVLVSRFNRQVLVWLAVVTAILVALQRIAVRLNDNPSALSKVEEVFSHEMMTNILVLWSLGLLLGASYLLRRTQAEREEWEAIFVSLGPDVLIVVRPDRVIQMCSPAVQAMYGYNPATVIGRTSDFLFQAAPTQPGGLDTITAISRFGFHVGAGIGIRGTGEQFPVETVTSALHGRRGMVVLIRDISERERARSEIIKARDEAQTATEAKGRAMAELEESYRKLKDLEMWRDNLSQLVVHDIKHAVGGIDGSLHLLERELGHKIGTEARRFLSCAHDFTADLLSMASTLLDVARLESAKMPLRKTPCDMQEVMNEVSRRVASLAGLKDIRVAMQCDPVIVFCDRELISRVILNLVMNAIQFAPEGSTVEVDCAAADGLLEVGVSDHGPGVPDELKASVFDKYTQGGTRVGNGFAGLGLTFCRLAIEAHGGLISVQSPWKPAGGGNAGSRFWFRMPVE